MIKKYVLLTLIIGLVNAHRVNIAENIQLAQKFYDNSIFHRKLAQLYKKQASQRRRLSQIRNQQLEYLLESEDSEDEDAEEPENIYFRPSIYTRPDFDEEENENDHDEIPLNDQPIEASEPIRPNATDSAEKQKVAVNTDNQSKNDTKDTNIDRQIQNNENLLISKTNNNIGIAPDSQVSNIHKISLFVFAVVIIILFALLALCSLWCRRKYKKHLLNQRLDIQNIGAKKRNNLFETNVDPDKYEFEDQMVEDEEGANRFNPIQVSHNTIQKLEKSQVNDKLDLNFKVLQKQLDSGIQKGYKSPTRSLYEKKGSNEFLVIQQSQDIEQEVEEALNDSFGNSQEYYPSQKTKQTAYISDNEIKKRRGQDNNEFGDPDLLAGLSEPEIATQAHFMTGFKKK